MNFASISLGFIHEFFWNLQFKWFDRQDLGMPVSNIFRTIQIFGVMNAFSKPTPTLRYRGWDSLTKAAECSFKIAAGVTKRKRRLNEWEIHLPWHFSTRLLELLHSIQIQWYLSQTTQLVYSNNNMITSCIFMSYSSLECVDNISADIQYKHNLMEYTLLVHPLTTRADRRYAQGS